MYSDIGNEVMLVHNFNRMFSAIRVEQFGKPKVAPITALEFPRSSIFHFLPTGIDCLGPEQGLPYLAKAEKLIYARHVLEYSKDHIVGKPVPLIRSDLNTKLLAYHRANRKIRQLKDDKIIQMDPRTLLVENYANLPYMYRYQQTLFSWYERYQNTYSTIWHRVAEDVKRYDRNNYIILELPTTLPSIASLKRAEIKRDNQTLNNMRTDTQLTFLDLWTWLGTHRDKSLLNILGDHQLVEVNLIIKVGNRFTNLNLGELNYWRTGVAGMVRNESYLESEAEIEFISKTLGLEYFQTQSIDQHATLDLDVLPEGMTTPGNEAVKSEVKPLLSAMQAQNRLYATCVAMLTQAQNGDLIDSVNAALERNAEIEAEVAAGAETVPPELKAQVDVVLGNAPTEEEEQFDAESIAKDLKAYDRLEDIDESTDFSIEPKTVEKQLTAEELAIESMKPLSYEECIDKACQQYIEAGTLSVKAHEAFKVLSGTYKTLKSPDGKGMLADNLKATPEDVKLTPRVMFDDDIIIDKSMTKSALPDFDRQYIQQVMQKDINATMMLVQRAGFPLLNYEVERITDAANDMELHTIEVATIKGSPRTTLRMLMPKLSRYGTFKTNNVEYTMRRQRIDLPITKINQTTVALTSAYGKHFVSRSGKVVNNYGKWIVDAIRARGMDSSDRLLHTIRFGNVFNHEIQVPPDYSSVAGSISRFTLNGVTYHFDYNNIHQHFPKEAIASLVNDSLLPVGVHGTTYYGMDKNNVIYKQTPKGTELVGTLPEILGLDTAKAPFEVATLTVSDKELSLGLVFSYYLGLEGMLKLFGVDYKLLDPNERIKPAPGEFVLKLTDCMVLITPSGRKQHLVANGLIPYQKVVTTFTLKDMNSPEVYQALIVKDRLVPYYLKELTNLDDMFIDPITLRILESRKEPQTWQGLLQKAVEMLVYDAHPASNDIDEQHIFGHQRIVMAMYTELSRAVREYRAKPNNSKKRLDIDVKAAWDRVHQDGSVAPASNGSPIHYVKQNAVVTFGGTGGRSRLSMTKPTRKYNRKDLGVISGDGVDNGDAGMTTYLAAGANLTTVDGIVDKNIDRDNLKAADYISLVSMTAPELEYDDSKRRVFYGIQIASTTSAKGYKRPSLLTGAETLIAHNTHPTQANVAIADGRVTAIDDTSITVMYGSGQKQTIESYPIGRHFGSHEGHMYPHDLITKLKVGDKVKAGDVISYNSKFFTENPFNPRQVDWMMGTVFPIMWLESPDTLEDTNMLGPELSAELESECTVSRDITVSFKQEIHNLKSEGDTVSYNTILGLLEDELTATASDVFSDQSLDTLGAISTKAPKAKHSGTIDRIEVFYNGELEDMSPTLRKIVESSDRKRRKQAGAVSGGVATSGRVDGSMRVGGKPIELDTAVIRIYISYFSPAIGGSKVVFGNQMKSTIRRVSPVTIKTELGHVVGGIFGKVSNDNRIVNSMFRQSAINTVGRLIGEDTLKIIEGKK